jgi:hypothetical protein
MKTKLILTVALAAALGSAIWSASHRGPANSGAASSGRKILYYQSAMHPWIKSDKPGKCPICGMNLVPIYEGESGVDTNMTPGMVKFNADSVSVMNVQTGTVERRPVRRTLHLAGQIIQKSTMAAWFEFAAYERDLQWLKTGQAFDVSVSSAPDVIYHAQIKKHGTKPFADADFDMMSGSTKVRAEILNPPVEPGDFGEQKLFNGLHAEAHVVAETEPTLTVPRSAIISRGIGPVVYVDKGDGHYAPRAVLLGRVGDEFSEVLAGLKEGEKVVTTGNVLIDSEAQLTAGE